MENSLNFPQLLGGMKQDSVRGMYSSRFCIWYKDEIQIYKTSVVMITFETTFNYVHK
jgi:hypothetical protein